MNRAKTNKNPSLQCSVCGKWKRLHGKDENGNAIQRFHAACEVGGVIMDHQKDVCDDCCDAGKCQNKNIKPPSSTKQEEANIKSQEE